MAATKRTIITKPRRTLPIKSSLIPKLRIYLYNKLGLRVYAPRRKQRPTNLTMPNNIELPERTKTEAQAATPSSVIFGMSFEEYQGQIHTFASRLSNADMAQSYEEYCSRGSYEGGY